MSETIRKTITIEAPPRAVFKALTDENELTAWFPNLAKLEAKVGGSVEFKFLREDGAVDHRVVGKVLELVPDKKFSMSWKNAADPDFPDTVVTWTLEQVDSRRTKVMLSHAGFEKGKWLDLHDGGWSYFVGRLAEYCKEGRVENRAMYKELGGEVRKTVVIDASPNVVFRALTDEKELLQWFPSRAAKLEARVGGAWEFKNQRPDTGESHTMRGRILEITPGKKLSYTWKVDDYPDNPESVVTWTLEPVDGGKTKITLVHSRLVGKTGDLEAGWSYFMGRLAEHCKNKK